MTAFLELFFAVIKPILAQSIAKIALDAIASGHVSKDDLLAEAHKDAATIVANTLVAAHVTPPIVQTSGDAS